MRQILAAAILLLASTAQAQVFDNAGMFKAERVEQANADLARLKDGGGPEVIVEMFAEAETKAFRSDADKAKFFSAWLRRAAEARNANGVYVLICKTPGRVQVDFHKRLVDAGHRQREMDAVRDAALGRLKAKDADGALLALTAKIIGLFAKPVEAPVGQAVKPAAAAAPAKFPVGWVIFGVAVAGILVVGFWIMFSSHEPEPVSHSQTVADGPSIICPACGGSTSRNPCEFCGKAVEFPEPVRRQPVASPQTQTVVHNNYGSGNDNLATGMMLGHMLSSPSHEPTHHSPPAESPSSGFDFGSSSGFDFGGGGGGFDGGSGGDF